MLLLALVVWWLVTIPLFRWSLGLNSLFFMIVFDEGQEKKYPSFVTGFVESQTLIGFEIFWQKARTVFFFSLNIPLARFLFVFFILFYMKRKCNSNLFHFFFLQFGELSRILKQLLEFTSKYALYIVIKNNLIDLIAFIDATP